MAMTRAEASVLEQTQAWHAGGAGRDLDAAVHLFRDPSGANAAVEHLEWFHQEDSESSVDVLIEVAARAAGVPCLRLLEKRRFGAGHSHVDNRGASAYTRPMRMPGLRHRKPWRCKEGVLPSTICHSQP